MTEMPKKNLDVVVAGAGFAGLYLLHKFREMGLTPRAFEAGDDVGGTWYWNRYPGARCDIESIDYSFSFDPELEQEWQWTEKYATQPEILSYAQHVADRFDLRKDITFATRVEKAVWDEDDALWTVTTDQGETVTARFFIMATGCLSEPKDIDIDGVENFSGEIYRTHSWPHEGVNFTGKTVGVIGTGSSGIQSIPLIAEQAENTTVFQRTANYSIPAGNGPIAPEKLAVTEHYQDYRAEARKTRVGVPGKEAMDFALTVSEEERQERYEELWAKGAIPHLGSEFADILLNEEANETLAEFVRSKVRSKIEDPELAEILTPTEFPICTKRACLDTNYYETFNKSNVDLVDIRKNPIRTITESGIATQDKEFDFDAIVFATGFDAMTGALMAVDIRGRDGQSLRKKWEHGPLNYLGLTVEGFPNFFMITGPGSPSVMTNMVLSIEQHVEWIADCLGYMADNNLSVIEPTATAENGWVDYVTATADMTLFPKAKSWYMGANVPGKPRVCLPYLGGAAAYRRACDDVAADDYLGFRFDGSEGSQCNDGLVRRQQPDVVALLEALAEMELPPFETLSAQDAREVSVAMNAANPPGPAVGEVADGKFPGAASELDYRLYRPDTAGPHPVAVYFHGGGWVLGDHASDDAFCRDLCVNSDSIIISANYRHGPEDRFPAAADDGFAALQWVADNAESLGGIPGELAVCGWSAGGNIAAVVSQLARDAGGPAIRGQILITPVVDGTDDSPSMTENAEGFVLTKALMDWFWDHYADPSERSDPRASPLLADSLAGLPPAFIVTGEFDPLRDQGMAYAEALAAAGTPARGIVAPGQIHTSFTAVGAIPTANGIRAEIANELKSCFRALETV
ncbi:Predicted flavoprotein CzcO associated with the cation diffusion facilitator CzcD [Parasphingorhabdus marina DSM 22363]|uniref:Predicted flavoprotein CzcO associated with the cation diffusion facilitator CzcD n=1 Tax=Parasphingorhabdus marina DSM 22363 TaxID=1123272 RepID=A0A1N6ELA7_9SPHN|nr:alpha/beta hydrolase fold domain-containing protein [Parasphingorhabdus marina]SIN83691.1 Predicted flavoprotein CzcO associated with the cation diffusion facilitator CzcD [Parasphingorhabdus marina DSM 22363]